MNVSRFWTLDPSRNRTTSLPARLRDRWSSLSLSSKFLALALLPVGANSLLIGDWVVRHVSDNVLRAEAASTALYIDATIEPLIKELTLSDHLSPNARASLDQLIKSTAFNNRFPMIKIWNTHGAIAYSSRQDLIGKVFPIDAQLKAALSGRVEADWGELSGPDHVSERMIGKPLFEFHIPVLQQHSDRVVAVVELYELADKLDRDLFYLRAETWTIVTALSASMLALLFGIVHRGSRLITEQRRQLVQRFEAQSSLMQENDRLHASLEGAYRRAAEGVEQFMRRIGSDLHDGPAQHIGLAVLHLEDLQSAAGTSPEALSVAARIDRCLEASLGELRGLSAGLASPELERLSLTEALRLAVSNYEWSTGSLVESRIDTLPNDVPQLLKISLYRFAQEGLGNAFRHAGGKDVSLRASYDGDAIEVEVADRGGGFPATVDHSERPRLGLSIMRDRIEAIGGTLAIDTIAGQGTKLRARVKISGSVGP